MKLIGLTGPSGSGKGYVAAVFAQYKIASVDTDAIVHCLYREDEDCIAELEQTFGPLTDDSGQIDRRRLAAMVFADPDQLARLNAIVHRYVWAKVEQIADAHRLAGEEFLLIDAPLLYEAGMDRLCQKVIAVIAPRELRKARLLARDERTSEEIDRRMNGQPADEFYTARADYVLCNDGSQSPEDFVRQILREVQDGQA